MRAVDTTRHAAQPAEKADRPRRRLTTKPGVSKHYRRIACTHLEIARNLHGSGEGGGTSGEPGTLSRVTLVVRSRPETACHTTSLC